MKSIDLHVHSTYSDGTLTPSELVKKAFSINLAAMALTDHVYFFFVIESA